MDFFLRIDGIPGESLQKGHERWLEVMSAEWGVSQQSTALRPHGGGGAGKAEFGPAAFSTATGVATPPLFEACASGTHIATATFEAVRSGERARTLARWEFEDVRVATLSTAGSEGSAGMVDAFTFAYARFRVTTFTQDPKGGVGAATARGWDLVANRAW